MLEVNALLHNPTCCKLRRLGEATCTDALWCACQMLLLPVNPLPGLVLPAAALCSLCSQQTAFPATLDRLLTTGTMPTHPYCAICASADQLLPILAEQQGVDAACVAAQAALGVPVVKLVCGGRHWASTQRVGHKRGLLAGARTAASGSAGQGSCFPQATGCASELPLLPPHVDVPVLASCDDSAPIPAPGTDHEVQGLSQCLQSAPNNDSRVMGVATPHPSSCPVHRRPPPQEPRTSATAPPWELRSDPEGSTSMVLLQVRPSRGALQTSGVCLPPQTAPGPGVHQHQEGCCHHLPQQEATGVPPGRVAAPVADWQLQQRLAAASGGAALGHRQPPSELQHTSVVNTKRQGPC